MLAELREAVTTQLMGLTFTAGEAPEGLEPEPLPPMQAHHINPLTGEDEFALADAALAPALVGGGVATLEPRTAPVKSRKADGGVDPDDPQTWGKVARNDKCPCGSGKKYKHCHGRHAG